MKVRPEDTERRTGRGYRAFEHQGWEILVGKGARDNDVLTFEVAGRNDLWMHVSGWSGSHVVVRVPEESGEPPREVVDYAARLAAWFSKGRGAKGKVEVHVCRAGDVRKTPRSPAGQVQLTRWTAVKVYAKDAPSGVDGDA
jgi:predicted ribosome quality control (RQC) complex YloA/Tae2 family protein